MMRFPRGVIATALLAGAWGCGRQPASAPAATTAAAPAPPTPEQARAELERRRIGVEPAKLVEAAGKCDADLVRLLLAAGVDANAASDPAAFWSPMRNALFSWKPQPEQQSRCRATMAALLDHGARPELRDIVGLADSGETELVRRVLDSGFDLNSTGEAGALLSGRPASPARPWTASSALLATASGRSLEMVELLVSRGAHVTGNVVAVHNAVNAIERGEREKDFDPRQFDNEGRILRYLLAHGADANLAYDDQNITPLMHAAIHGVPEAVRILLEAGAQVNARDHLGRTAHDRARQRTAQSGWTGRYRARSVETLELLEKAGGQPGLGLH